MSVFKLAKATDFTKVLSDFFMKLTKNLSQRYLGKIERINVWGAAKTVHMGQDKIFSITTSSYFSAFSEQFVLYLKVLAILVPEI